MRSNKPKRGLLVAVLMILAAAEIAAGTCVILTYKTYRDQLSHQKAETEYRNEEVPQEDEPAVDEEDPYEDDAEEDIDAENEDDEADIDTEEDEEDEDEGKDEEEPEKDYVVMTVSAPDNYAAVRAGRGTQYQEVGRITNGHRVALTDLENGWYRIAKGKYKGYYTHQSSYVAG